MENIRDIFERNTRTRVNLVCNSNSQKTNLLQKIIKDGICDDKEKVNQFMLFPTEILCCSPNEKKVHLYIEIKSKDEILNKLKNIIISVIDECIIKEVKKEKSKKKEEFLKLLDNQHKLSISLKAYFNKLNLNEVFNNVDFDQLFTELNNYNYSEVLEERDNYIWNKYFNKFVETYSVIYEKWLENINKYYYRSESGTEYVNEISSNKKIFRNKELNSILKVLYNDKNSCALMIKRSYISIPSKENLFSNMVFIDCENIDLENNITKKIEKRISKDYKELFLLILPCKDYKKSVLKVKNQINKVSLEKRVFCILNNFEQCRNLWRTNSNNNMLDAIKLNVRNILNIPEDRIIITEKFNDIDKKSLEMINTNSDLLKIIKSIKAKSIRSFKGVKIRNPSKKKIISITLNQERMSVKALMEMLYERYNGHLVTAWKDIIDNLNTIKEKNSEYYSDLCRAIVRNRKYNLKRYQYNILDKDMDTLIDFSLRSGDHNESKKILKMLLNYGYHSIGFNPDENKVIVKVNGEITNEDKRILIDSIKGRLEESSIIYFENAFLRNITKSKFNTTNLEEALNEEINITIDDFYRTIQEMFNNMSKNIQRYELIIE